MNQPALKPKTPFFSSGPCAKRSGWSVAVLKDALLSRSHRSGIGKKRLKEIIDRHRSLLKIPDHYRIAIVPASNTGAIEMAMWSLLGERGVDVLAWENFGHEWLVDITKQLKLHDVRTLTAEYGAIPNLSQTDPQRDIVFTWNGTTSGVCVPDGDWISDTRTGLTFCDATSAVFAWDMPWHKLDVVTWSWQKVLGGEAAHGMLVLSDRAVERLKNYNPPWPLPKIFRMTGKSGLIEGLFEGETLNTPSMLAAEDCLDALKWVESIGGVPSVQKRVRDNARMIDEWVQKTDWIDHLVADPSVRSITSVCLKIVDPWFEALPETEKMPFIKAMTGILDKESVAYDINSYKSAPPGLRIWCGATVEAEDLRLLTPWLDWVYAAQKASPSTT